MFGSTLAEEATQPRSLRRGRPVPHPVNNGSWSRNVYPELSFHSMNAIVALLRIDALNEDAVDQPS